MTNPNEGSEMICDEHGEQPTSGEVCLVCYAEQQERVERESAPLREANTAERLHAWAVAEHGRRSLAANGRAPSEDGGW